MAAGAALGSGRRSALMAVSVLGLVAALGSCGGGSTGNPRDSGTNKTTLRVDASSADGAPLQYQWRVTGGTIDNRNAVQTTWTMPDGPGLHFAYVLVSDGKGGYAQQQYAVATDSLGTTAPVRQAVAYQAPATTDFDGTTMRLSFVSGSGTLFTPPAGGTAAQRYVYLPDVRVQVVKQSTGATVFSGLSDLGGDVDLPKLENGQSYEVDCSTAADGPLALCSTFSAGTVASRVLVQPAQGAAQNLRLFGHVALADGGVCGFQDEFFAIQAAATVSLLASDGSTLAPPTRVNRFGDYEIDAAVPVHAALKLAVQCEGYSAQLAVPAATGAAGYVSTAPVELSHQMPGHRPTVVKVVANGPDGNVRGTMVVPDAGASSTGAPGAFQFLTYKGRDTRMGACLYYRALGAAQGCDAQGGLINPISFDDWKRARHFAPYTSGNTEVAANYINRFDLNLVRQMVATQTGPADISFYVCNHPGPDGATQYEVDAAMSTALANLKEVACVAMEWSVTPGVNQNKPFTKFLTFGPDGALLTSINLDTRGEKYMPGACVACHGGTGYNGRFPDQGTPSAFLGSGFLPFDTGNYLFGSAAGLSESAQSASLYQLNQLVRATELSDTTATANLVKGWYAGGGTMLDKNYLPPAWATAEAATPGAARLYHQVVGASCRTCHASLGPGFNWDATVLSPARAKTHVCGGTADVAINASMPNALISRDRVAERVQADATLGALMTQFLGCSAPSPDPVYPKR